jgi:hypothetical protein
MRVKKSRPRSSTPNQCAAEGKARRLVRNAWSSGPTLVINGAAIAITMTMTNTMPAPNAPLLAVKRRQAK